MSQQPSPTEEAATSNASPPLGRPRREGNDSLWKRARRTLGTNSLTFLQPQSRPAGATTSAAGSGPAAPSKRREQVRHAQRTHRQRTQNYIKTLESEVVRLRESETKLMQERGKLRGQIDILRTTIILSDIPLPAGAEDTSSPSAQHTSPPNLDMPATVSYSADDLNHQRLHVNFPRQGSNQSVNYPLQTTDHGAIPYQQPQTLQSTPDLPNDFSFRPMSFSSADVASADVKDSALVDTIEIAIDFVLALEHPCMPHIPFPADPPTDDPAMHMMMASTPLVARAPDSPKLNSTWATSGSIIKELLNLASSINLEGEITPVEAWHRLHQHPDFWRLNRNDIENLKRELSTAVRCCGFGAVLDENVFRHALNHCLAATAIR